MAYLTETRAPANGGLLARIFRAIGHMIVAAAESQSRRQMVLHFEAMSDGVLGARGIKRDDIIRHVYRDGF